MWFDTADTVIVYQEVVSGHVKVGEFGVLVVDMEEIVWYVGQRGR